MENDVSSSIFDGITRAARYAFGPNRLHYCGPDANREMLQYLKEGREHIGLEHLLSKFQTMYPYLKHIANANNIRDPFDERVVEAYWIGNRLLETVEKQKFWRHLAEDHQLKKKSRGREFGWIEEKIRKGALPTHSFHVLNVWRRTGNEEKNHTLESMDQCRISWGQVISADGPSIYIETEPLVLQNGKLALGSPESRKIARNLDADGSFDGVVPGDMISIHWGMPCEILTSAQAAALRKYTMQHIALANMTI